MRLIALLASLAVGAEWKWHQSVSPHFVVSHESPWAPPGFVISLEKMHNRLRRDLAMFSPWMAKERLNLFLYAKPESYLAGEFSPPSWSNGIALLDKKTVVVFDQPSRAKLHEVISHETTHLLFEGYWDEVKKAPPQWLNEGLAMMEETDSLGAPEGSEWYQAMVFWPEEEALPFEEFFKLSPTKDITDDKQKVSAWYIQAFSVVTFLYRKHSRLQFKDLCARLRDGKDLGESLWVVYRYPKIKDFEQAWRTWLANPEHRRRVEKAAGVRKAQEGKPKEFKAMRSFDSLR